MLVNKQLLTLFSIMTAMKPLTQLDQLNLDTDTKKQVALRNSQNDRFQTSKHVHVSYKTCTMNPVSFIIL